MKISRITPPYYQLVAYSQTDEFKQAMKRRLQIERIIAGLVLPNDKVDAFVFCFFHPHLVSAWQSAWRE